MFSHEAPDNLDDSVRSNSRTRHKDISVGKSYKVVEAEFGGVAADILIDT